MKKKAKVRGTEGPPSGAMLSSNTLCLSLHSCSFIHVVPLLGILSLLPAA